MDESDAPTTARHERPRWRIKMDATLTGEPPWIKRGEVYEGTDVHPEAGPLQLIGLRHPTRDGIEFSFYLRLLQLERVE
jgi:hypothetical protein